jgi:hypothetical protein
MPFVQTPNSHQSSLSIEQFEEGVTTLQPQFYYTAPVHNAIATESVELRPSPYGDPAVAPFTLAAAISCHCRSVLACPGLTFHVKNLRISTDYCTSLEM